MKKAIIGLIVIGILLVVAYQLIIRYQNNQDIHDPLAFTEEQLEMIEANQETIEANNEILTQYLSGIGLDLGIGRVRNAVRRLGTLGVERIEETTVIEQLGGGDSIVRIKDETGTIYYAIFSSCGVVQNVRRDDMRNRPIFCIVRELY